MPEFVFYSVLFDFDVTISTLSKIIFETHLGVITNFVSSLFWLLERRLVQFTGQ